VKRLQVLAQRSFFAVWIVAQEANKRLFLGMHAASVIVQVFLPSKFGVALGAAEFLRLVVNGVGVSGKMVLLTKRLGAARNGTGKRPLAVVHGVQMLFKVKFAGESACAAGAAKRSCVDNADMRLAQEK
jgi:hypothetical protein